MNKKITTISALVVFIAGFVFGPTVIVLAGENHNSSRSNTATGIFGPGDAHFGSVAKSKGTGLPFLKGKTMNKAELIESIASEANLTKADTRRALDVFIGAITKSLKGGKRVALVGFGSFSISKRKARTGRNLEKVVRFKAGDRSMLPNIEYATTEDIIETIQTEMVSMSLSGSVSKEQNFTEDQVRKFMDSFTNVILSVLQTGLAVNVGDDFGTFWIPPIGHVDHGKFARRHHQTGGTIQIPAKRVIKFKAGNSLSKRVA